VWGKTALVKRSFSEGKKEENPVLLKGPRLTYVEELIDGKSRRKKGSRKEKKGKVRKEL